MRKSKFMKALLVFGMSVVTATSMVGIAACNPDSGNGDDNGNGNGHQHSYDGWNTSKTEHWHECLECSEEADRGNHVDVKNNKTDAAGADNYCDVCGYELAHTFADTWSKDASGHWHAAICDHTSEIDELLPHVDTDKNNVCDDCGYVGAVAEDYTTLAEKEDATTVIANTFFAQNIAKLPVFSTFGTSGLYTVADDGVDTNANYVTVSGGIAKHVTAGSNVGLLADFGGSITEKVVEGYVEVKPTAMGTKWSLITFYDGTQNTEKTGKCDDTNRVFALTTNTSGTLSYTLTNKEDYKPSETTIAPAPNTLYKIYYKFDLTTGRVTVTVNGSYVVNNADLGITKLSGYQLISSSSGARLLEMDNIIAITREATLDDYVEAVKADINGIEDLLPASLKGSEAKTAADTALENPADKAACDTAYSTYNTAIVATYKTYVDEQITANYAGKYTMAPNKSGYETAKTALENALADSDLTVQNAIAAYDTFVAAVSELKDDDYYKSSSTVFTVDYLVDGSATGTTKTLTLYAEDTLTKAALDEALGLPVNKKVVGWYTSSTTQDETTAVAFGNKHDTYTTTTLYAVIADAVYTIGGADITSAATEDTQIGEYFVITNKVKSESNKVTDSGYTKQISLTGGKAATDANSIKFVVAEGATATVKVVAARKADSNKPNLPLAVLNASGSAATVSNLKIDNVDATEFNQLASDKTQTYTFTLSAGTYYVGGGVTGGAYIFELVVSLDVAA